MQCNLQHRLRCCALHPAARAPLAPLPYDAPDCHANRGHTTVACTAASDTPCISMLLQKAEGLSLRSALPPAREPPCRATRWGCAAIQGVLSRARAACNMHSAVSQHTLLFTSPLVDGMPDHCCLCLTGLSRHPTVSARPRLSSQSTTRSASCTRALQVRQRTAADRLDIICCTSCVSAGNVACVADGITHIRSASVIACLLASSPCCASADSRPDGHVSRRRQEPALEAAVPIGAAEAALRRAPRPGVHAGAAHVHCPPVAAGLAAQLHIRARAHADRHRQPGVHLAFRYMVAFTCHSVAFQ